MSLIGSANVVVHNCYPLPKDSVGGLVFYKDLRICLFPGPGPNVRISVIVRKVFGDYIIYEAPTFNSGGPPKSEKFNYQTSYQFTRYSLSKITR